MARFSAALPKPSLSCPLCSRPLRRAGRGVLPYESALLYGPFDIVFRHPATAIAAWLTMKMPRWYLAALPPFWSMPLSCRPCGPGRDWSSRRAFWAACGFNALTFIPGEALAAMCWGPCSVCSAKVPACGPTSRRTGWPTPENEQDRPMRASCCLILAFQKVKTPPYPLWPGRRPGGTSARA